MVCRSLIRWFVGSLVGVVVIVVVVFILVDSFTLFLVLGRQHGYLSRSHQKKQYDISILFWTIHITRTGGGESTEKENSHTLFRESVYFLWSFSQRALKSIKLWEVTFTRISAS